MSMSNPITDETIFLPRQASELTAQVLQVGAERGLTVCRAICELPALETLCSWQVQSSSQPQTKYHGTAQHTSGTLGLRKTEGSCPAKWPWPKTTFSHLIKFRDSLKPTIAFTSTLLHLLYFSFIANSFCDLLSDLFGCTFVCLLLSWKLCKDKDHISFAYPTSQLGTVPGM